MALAEEIRKKIVALSLQNKQDAIVDYLKPKLER